MPGGREKPRRYGPFREVFGDLLREKQKLPLGRINVRAFCSEIPDYDYSTLRRMIAGSIPLQPKAMELMAAALGVPPETFFEYQAYRICQVLASHPELSPHVYKQILTHGQALDELRSAQDIEQAHDDTDNDHQGQKHPLD